MPCQCRISCEGMNQILRLNYLSIHHGQIQINQDNILMYPHAACMNHLNLMISKLARIDRFIRVSRNYIIYNLYSIRKRLKINKTKQIITCIPFVLHVILYPSLRWSYLRDDHHNIRYILTFKLQHDQHLWGSGGLALITGYGTTTTATPLWNWCAANTGRANGWSYRSPSTHIICKLDRH